jgi:hypothetical protein
MQILRDWTQMYLDRAADMAEGGNKDMAREFAKLFSQSRVIELLGRKDIGVLNGWERSRMEKQLAAVSGACHPEDRHDYASDLAAVRGQLERISRHLGLDQPASEDSNIINFPGAQRPAPGGK